MFQVAISQLTTLRWDLEEELEGLALHGFDCLSLWRPKVSDLGTGVAAAILSRTGVRVSSLQWAGGFTGSDGRTFAESLADTAEAIEVAAVVAAPVLVVHSGCRGGHTRAHARRLLVEALGRLAPIARSAGVTLAIKPFHAAAASESSFLDGLAEALDLVDQVAHAAVGLAVDLWHFADAPDLPGLLPRLAAAAAVVQVADRRGPPTEEMERLPAGQGTLPLEEVAMALVDHGYGGDFEFDPVGDAVASIGYAGALADTRRVSDAWRMAAAERLDWSRTVASSWQAAGPRTAARAERPGDSLSLRGIFQFRSPGSRRSQASSQTVSRG